MSSTIPLPAELRHLIYVELFCFTRPLRIFKDPMGNFAAGHMDIEPFEKISSIGRGFPSTRGTITVIGISAAGFLRVSRDTSAEARAVLYGANQFFIDLMSHTERPVFEDISMVIGHSNAALIRRASIPLLAGALFEEAKIGGGAKAPKSVGRDAATWLCRRYPALVTLDMQLVPAHLPGILPYMRIPGVYGSPDPVWMVSLWPYGLRRCRGCRDQEQSELQRGLKGTSPDPAEWAAWYEFSQWFRQHSSDMPIYESDYPDVDAAVSALQETISGFADSIRSWGPSIVTRTSMAVATSEDPEMKQWTRQFLDALVAATRQQGWEETETVYGESNKYYIMWNPRADRSEEEPSDDGSEYSLEEGSSREDSSEEDNSEGNNSEGDN